MKKFEISMEWDSYEGSLFKETNFVVREAFSESEARQKVASEFGHNKGFAITIVIQTI